MSWNEPLLKLIPVNSSSMATNWALGDWRARPQFRDGLAQVVSAHVHPGACALPVSRVDCVRRACAYHQARLESTCGAVGARAQVGGARGAWGRGSAPAKTDKGDMGF